MIAGGPRREAPDNRGDFMAGARTAGWAAGAAAALAAGLVVVPGSAVAASVLRVCAHGCAYAQIQPAVDAAAAGDTIAVGPGSYTGGIVIAKALRVSGAGAGSTVISGGGPVITVSAGPVLLRGVTVTGGRAPGDGGGILNTGMLTVTGATIRGNTADGNGGGIAGDGTDLLGAAPASLVLRGDIITGNTASGDGGGLASTGVSARATVRGTVIAGNTAGQDGGGIAAEDSAGLSLHSGTVSANSAGDSGGIAVLTEAAATISGTTVDRNSGALTGGIVVYEATLHMADGAINGNTATDPDNGFGGGVTVAGGYHRGSGLATITGTSINRNSAATGGGIAISLSTAVLVNDVISTNTASTEGGGIDIAYRSDLRMNDTSVTRNVSGGDGGGVSIGYAFTSAELTNDGVNANSAAGRGGGLFSGVAAAKIVTLDRDTSVNRNHAAAGGGIYVLAGQVRVGGATVRGNIPDNCEPATC